MIQRWNFLYCSTHFPASVTHLCHSISPLLFFSLLVVDTSPSVYKHISVEYNMLASANWVDIAMSISWDVVFPCSLSIYKLFSLSFANRCGSHSCLIWSCLGVFLDALVLRLCCWTMRWCCVDIVICNLRFWHCESGWFESLTNDVPTSDVGLNVSLMNS